MSYASVAAKRVEQRVDDLSSANVRVNAIPRADERDFAVVVRASKDANVKMTSEQIKERVLRDVSGGLNVRVKAVRKTRSGGVAIETVS